MLTLEKEKIWVYFPVLKSYMLKTHQNSRVNKQIPTKYREAFPPSLLSDYRQKVLIKGGYYCKIPEKLREIPQKIRENTPKMAILPRNGVNAATI